MSKYLSTRPVMAGMLAMASVGAASGTAAAWKLPWEGVLLIAGGVGIVAAWVFVLNPARTRQGVQAALRTQAAEALTAAGSAHVLSPPTDDLSAVLREVLEELGGRVPRANAEARAAHEARSVAEAVLDGVWFPVLATNAEGTIIVANAAALRFLGETEARAVIGRHLADRFTQRDIVELHAAAAAGKQGKKEVRWAAREGQRIVEVSAAPWGDSTGGGAAGGLGGGAGGGAVITARDITELAVAAQLKTDFVANASHEVRTPLAAIKAAVETLENGADEDAMMRPRLIRMISDNAVRLEDLTRDLLDLSRLESPEAPPAIQAVRAEAMVSAMQSLFGAASAERNVKLEFAVGRGAEELRTDPRLLQLILRNLIENSLKFAYEKSAVRISAERVDHGVRWRVVDHGIGIPIDQQQRIFERFYQVDQSRVGNGPKGTGLGLAIVKHAVKSLGGTIRVDSVWKQGTTMTVDLPG